MTTIYVCGSRHYDDIDAIFIVLTSHRDRLKSISLIHDGEGLLATVTAFFAGMNKIPVLTVNSKSTEDTQPLITNKPDMILAFHSDINSSQRTKERLIEAAEQDIPAYVVSGSSKTKVRVKKSDYQHIIG